MVTAPLADTYDSDLLGDSFPQAEPVATEAGDERHILVVDDDLDQVEALAFRLRQQGFQVLTAAAGQRGMQLAREMRPALILLDLRLPDMTGFDVCAQLVDAAETCGIPIIIVSGLEHEDIVRQARAAGCEYYVRKPYDPNVLLTLIQDAIRRADPDW